MTLRKQKAERKQQLVKNVEEMKQELAKVSKNGIEHRKNIFEIWFAFPKMVCFYPSSDLECLHFFFQVWFTKEYLNSKVMSPHKSQYIVQSGIKEEFFFLFKVVLSRTGLCKYILGKKWRILFDIELRNQLIFTNWYDERRWLLILITLYSTFFHLISYSNLTYFVHDCSNVVCK